MFHQYSDIKLNISAWTGRQFITGQIYIDKTQLTWTSSWRRLVMLNHLLTSFLFCFTFPLRLQVRSALNAASQLCSQDSVFESPTLLLGVWIWCQSFLHPAHYQGTKSPPTIHGCQLELFQFSLENHKISLFTEPPESVLSGRLAVHVEFCSEAVTSPMLNLDQCWTWSTCAVKECLHPCLCERTLLLARRMVFFAKKKIPLTRRNTCRSNYCQVVMHPHAVLI